MKLFKFVLGCLVFLFAVGIALAIYEHIIDGPWYMYRNSAGDKVAIGQDVRTTFDVYDEDGSLIDTAPGWEYEGAAPNAYIKGKDGKLRFRDPIDMPQWIDTTDKILHPLLLAGHFVVDYVVDFFGKLT
jgi:hypothetical protein